MAVSSGQRRLFADLFGWTCVAAAIAIGIVFHNEIRSAGYRLFGLKEPQRIAAAEQSSPPRRTKSQQEAATASGRVVELKAGRNGHFFADAEINGRRIEVMIDTGASIVALTYEDAQAAGVTPRDADFTHKVSTANGIARVAPVMLSRLQIGDVMVRNVEAAVAEPGKLNTTLVGNSFLGRLSRYEMRAGRLVLEE